MGKHKEWRKVAKKLRRKRIRSKIAQARDQLLQLEEERLNRSPRYQAWLLEQETLEEFQLEEEERQRQARHRKWLEDEELAQIAWREKQIRAAHAKQEKEQQILLLKEKLQEEERKKQEELDKEEEERRVAKLKQEKLRNSMLDYINGTLDELPPELSQTSQTQPGKDECPFFSKVGACRFFEHCSRNHKRPGVSKVLLFAGLYTHFSLYNHTFRSKEYDTDITLEYDNSETYHHFDEFFCDIVGEIKKLGKIKLVKVCKNSELHLRGNVYVQFKSERDALRAYSSLLGRYYAGKQLSPVFVTIPSWKNAICGQQWNKRCLKGSLCNFLHVFSNPYGRFSRYDDRNSNSDTPKNRWSSESPEDRRSWRSSKRSRRERSRSTERSKGRASSRRSDRNKKTSSKHDSERSRTSISNRSRRSEKSSDKRRNGDSSIRRRKRRRSRDHRSRERAKTAWETKDNLAPGWSSSSDDEVKQPTDKIKKKKSRRSDSD